LLYERFRDRVAFVFVYIAEAHPVDEWQMQSNEDEGVLVRHHRTLDERFAAAREGAARLGLQLPLLVDDMDDAVSNAFAAWPERIYVVSAGGIVAYVGAPGPWGFDPDAAGEALAEVVSR
jgi:hypothetical protein